MAGLLGEENGLAVHGALLHMVNHSLIKLTLFMSAGAVYMRLHRLNLNEIRGFGRGKPVLRFAFLMGYLSIIGMPLWSGFVSKSLLHESIVEYIAVLAENGMAAWPYRLIEIIFLVTGGMTAAYMTKLYVALFCEKNADAAEQKRFDGMAYMPLNARLALALSAALLPVMGVFSNALMRPVAQLCQSFMNSEGPAEAVNYFSGANLLGAAESLLIGAALYFGVVRMLLMKKNAQGVREYVDRWPRWLDLENGVYRPLLEKILPGLVMPATRFLDRLADYARVVLNAAATFAVRIMDECVDGVVLILKRTLFGRLKKRQPVPVGNRFTYSLGCVFDSVVLVLNKTFCRKRPIETRFVSVFAAGLDEMNDNVKKITRSVSFGLLLLCVGLYIAFAYILTR